MSINTIFCLNGVGYLHDVLLKDHGLHARINVIHQFNSSAQHSDDVWIDCVVNDNDLLLLLDGLKFNLDQQKTVILHFNIAYCGFDYCQSAITNEDPSNIVFFKGKLQRVDQCFIDGSNFNDQPFTRQQVVNYIKK